MKAFRLAAIALAAALTPTYATADDVMQITYNDGTTAQFIIAEIDDMTFKTVEAVEAPTHEAVDLGLPSGLKWATCNIGANRFTEYGNYFSWGGLTTKDSYDATTCPWWEVDMSSLEEQGVVDAYGNLTAQYDAATAAWGADWRIPTPAEFGELFTNCECKWATIEGHNGLLVTGVNGNSIFLPASGYRLNNECLETIYEGDYWTTNAYGNAGAYYFFFNRSSAFIDQANRFCGMTIRSVFNNATEVPGEEPGEEEGT